jgi:hypothetical protein
MKTAMQELIDDLRELKKHSKDNKQDTSFDIGMTFAIARAELRLEKEKEQIIDAHFNGMDKLATSLSEFLPIKHTMSVIQEIKNAGDIHEDGEQYYNQTYKNR